jgi:hypothetical protein
MTILDHGYAEAARGKLQRPPTPNTVLANTRVAHDAAGDTLHRVTEILTEIDYKTGWLMSVSIEHLVVWMTPRFLRQDVVTGEWGWGTGGRGAVSEQATTSQIVQQAFGLFRAAEEHECREHFRYMGQRVFGPHIDVNALVEIATDTDREFGTR